MPLAVEMRSIRRAEQKLGRALPPSDLLRIGRCDGGQVVAGHDTFQLHPILEPSNRKRLARTCNDIVRETIKARERPGFPSDALAIGDDVGGDLLVLLPDPHAPRFADAVYWWDHATGELKKVADALEDLR